MGGDPYFNKIKTRWSATGPGTTAGVSVTRSAPTGTKRLMCTAIQCSGDAAAVVTVESPSGTVLYQKRFAAAFTMSETFVPGTVVGPEAGAMLVKISASTAACEANIQGFTF